jgi:hypothetical protein
MAQVEGFEPYSPHPNGEPRYVLEQVVAVLREYAANLPLTLRQIFYRLVALEVIDKTEQAYQRLGSYVRKARRASVLPEGERGTTPYIPFLAIRDDSTSMITPVTYGSSGDFDDTVMDSVRNFKLDRQTGQPQAIEIWCEAAGLMPILAQLADPYSIPVYSSGGVDKLTPKYELALRAQRYAEQGVMTRMLHVGDFDPTGEMIHRVLSEDIGQMVSQLTGEDGWYEVERVALTPQQIVDRQVITAPAKPKDNNLDRFIDDNQWLVEQLGTEHIAAQLEALTPTELTSMLKEVITSYVDLEAYDEVLAEEAEIRKQLVGQYTTNPWVRAAYKRSDDSKDDKK